MRSSSQSLEITAKTVDEAVEQALRRLGVQRSEVEIVVLKEGRVGFLGFGAEDAVVRVSIRRDEGPRLSTTVSAPAATRPVRAAPSVQLDAQPVDVDDTAETAQIILEDLIDRMHLHAAVRQGAGERGPQDDDDRSRVTLDIRGEDMGLLIGRRGETLTALQLMLNMLVSRRLKRRTTVTVDVEGYRRRREEDLARMAQRVAGQVKSSGQPFTFEPMQARERRLIHVALAGDSRVMTESTGDGEQRRVVVMIRPGASSAAEPSGNRAPARSRGPRPQSRAPVGAPVIDDEDEDEEPLEFAAPADGSAQSTSDETTEGEPTDSAQDRPFDATQDRR